MSTSIELLTQCSIDILVQVLVFDTAFSSCDMRLAPTRIECYFMCYDDSMCWMFSYNPTLSQCCMVAGGAVAQETTSSQPGTHIYKVENVRTRCMESYYTYSRTAGLCFKVFSGVSNWNDAKADCESQGASLIKVDSVQKQNAINSYLQFEVLAYIGGNKKNPESKWRWLDGSDVKEVNEDWTVTDFGSSSCLALKLIIGFCQWTDARCDTTVPVDYICEISQ